MSSRDRGAPFVLAMTVAWVGSVMSEERDTGWSIIMNGSAQQNASRKQGVVCEDVVSRWSVCETKFETALALAVSTASQSNPGWLQYTLNTTAMEFTRLITKGNICGPQKDGMCERRIQASRVEPPVLAPIAQEVTRLELFFTSDRWETVGW